MVVLANYSLHERLGAGGFGEVFRARHDRIGRDVAIKVLHAKYSEDPVAVARFVAEARAANKIAHPNIVEVFDFGELDDGRSYFVMELLRGQNLRALLDARGALPLAEALPILAHVADAIDAAHAVGIVHRDLKPDNVFIGDDGAVKLIDFGIAKLTGEVDTPVTETGTVFGTPLYMAPEQCRGDRSDHRADAYSFGVLAYHVLTGTTPFTGDALALALHHLNDAPEPPSQRNAALDERIDRVLLALLAKEPADRPVPLRAAVAQLSPESPLPPRPRARVRRMVWLSAAITGVLAIGAGVTLFALRSSAPVEDEACPSSVTRLRGVWDPATRARIEARVNALDRVDVPGFWKVYSQALDDRNAQWAKMWDQACASPDRVEDPLRYAQRITCLDNQLAGTRVNTDTLLAGDLASFIGSSEGLNVNVDLLEDCLSPNVLRAQPDGVPSSRRALVAAMEAEATREYWQAWGQVGGRWAQYTDPLLTILHANYRTLAALGSPSAVVEMSTLAGLYQVRMGMSPPPPNSLRYAREIANEAIETAIATHNDYGLPYAYSTLAEIERVADNFGGASDALDRAEASLERAGPPALTRITLGRARALLEQSRGNFARARAVLEQTTKYGAAVPDMLPEINLVMATGLAIYGDVGAAAELLRTTNADLTKRWGPYLGAMRRFRPDAFWLLLATGDVAGAREQADAEMAMQEATHADPVPRGWAHVMRAVTELMQGDRGAATAQLKAWTDAVFVGKSLDASLLQQIASELDTSGLSDLALVMLDLAEAAGPSEDVRGDIADERAGIAFQRGDFATMARWLSGSERNPPNRFGPWYLAIADAHAGRAGSVDERLRVLRPSVPDVPFPAIRAKLAVLDGIAQFELQRWREAGATLTNAVEQMNSAGVVGNDLGEAHVWLAASRAAGRDVTGAKAAYEVALQKAWGGGATRGRVYYTPTAQFGLAQLLDEDQPRAKLLAKAAIAGFKLQGPSRDADRATVEAWLAAR